MTMVNGANAHEPIFALGDAHEGCGGRHLRPLTLDTDMFAGDRMKGEASVALMQMKARELSAELEAREHRKSGRKAVLRQRLYAVIIADELDVRDAERDADGG